MIPEEVANIAYILRERFAANEDDEDDYNYSIKIAWEIYNGVMKPIINSYEQAHLEGSY